jgi:hypothetical protein
MALILCNDNGSSISSRLNLLLLITFVLVCFCSSSSLSLPIYDFDSSTNDINDDLSFYRFVDIPEPAIYPWKNPFRNLLLKSIEIQPTYRKKDYNNKRYASQAFHAMRG